MNQHLSHNDPDPTSEPQNAHTNSAPIILWEYTAHPSGRLAAVVCEWLHQKGTHHCVQREMAKKHGGERCTVDRCSLTCSAIRSRGSSTWLNRPERGPELFALAGFAGWLEGGEERTWRTMVGLLTGEIELRCATTCVCTQKESL